MVNDLEREIQKIEVSLAQVKNENTLDFSKTIIQSQNVSQNPKNEKSRKYDVLAKSQYFPSSVKKEIRQNRSISGDSKKRKLSNLSISVHEASSSKAPHSELSIEGKSDRSKRADL